MDDTAELEEHLKELAREREDACEAASELATLVAYQQLLLSRLSATYAALQRGSTVEPATPFSRVEFPPAGVMPESNLDVAYALVSLVWQRLAQLKGAGELFLDAHNKFLALTRKGARNLGSDPSFAEFCAVPGCTVTEQTEESESAPVSSEVEKLQRTICLGLPHDPDKVSLDKRFHPSAEVLEYLEEHLGEDVSVEGLKKLHGELERTTAELENYLAEAQQMHARTMDFMEFPELDVVREVPEYREYCASNERELTALQTDLIGFREAFDATVSDLAEMHTLFKGAYVWPELKDDEVEGLIRQQTDSFHRQRKLLLFQHIVQQAPIKNPYAWVASEFVSSEVQVLEQMMEMAKKGEFDAFREAVSDEFEKIGNVEDELEREIAEVNSAKNGAISTQTSWLQRKTHAVYSDVMEELEASRQETQKKVQDLTETRQAVKEGLDEVASKLAAVVEAMPNVRMLPDGFVPNLKEVSEKHARREWLKLRVEAQRARVKQLKEDIDVREKELATLAVQLQHKEKEFTELEEKSKVAKPVEVSRADDDRRAMYYCGACQERDSRRRRDTIITNCGHTFCTHCVEETIRARNRKCPYCAQKFNPTSHVVRIRWPS